MKSKVVGGRRAWAGGDEVRGVTSYRSVLLQRDVVVVESGTGSPKWMLIQPSGCFSSGRLHIGRMHIGLMQKEDDEPQL